LLQLPLLSLLLSLAQRPLLLPLLLPALPCLEQGVLHLQRQLLLLLWLQQPQQPRQVDFQTLVWRHALQL
jgi:hypothetical protein